MKKYENIKEKDEKCHFFTVFLSSRSKNGPNQDEKDDEHEIFNDFNNFAISLLSVFNECRS